MEWAEGHAWGVGAGGIPLIELYDMISCKACEALAKWFKGIVTI